MKKVPSIYICGMPVLYMDDSIYGGLFGNATRSVGLAVNLQTNGYKVFLEVSDDFQNKISDYSSDEYPVFVCEKDRDAALSEVDVLLISCTNFDSLMNLAGGNPYLLHPKTLYACCFDHNTSLNANALKYGRSLITFNNHIQKKNWDSRKTGISSYVRPYGVNEKKVVDESIVNASSENVIWIGGIRRVDMLQRLVRFAVANPEANVTVVARSIFDGTVAKGERGSRDNPFGEFTNRDPLSHFDSVVLELCDIPAPENIEFLGPMEGENHTLLGNSSIGLDFSRFPAQDHDNTKIMDYLRSGLCVICDKGTPSYRFVEETGYGVVVEPDFTTEEIRDAFLRCQEMISFQRRKEIASYMNERHGWGTRAIEYSELIQKLCASEMKWRLQSLIKWINLLRTS